MLTISSPTTAIVLCILTMIGWGSWANTQKLAGKRHWPFELFYWDYSIGVALTGALFLLLGSNVQTASADAIFKALVAGGLFNLANVLLVAAIDAAGMSVAFPVGIGLALIIGTTVSYIQTPKGNAVLIACGVVLILAAMILSSIAHSRMPKVPGSGSASGLLFAIIAGMLMGFFYPQLMRSISPAPGMLTPYTALLFFGIGVLISSIPINGWFMRSRGSRFAQYLQAESTLHIPGILGGAIWMTALGLNVIASGVAGPAISYALGQGATLIAALWGIFVWREFHGAPSGTNGLLAAMLAAYAAGIALIGMATL